MRRSLRSTSGDETRTVATPENTTRTSNESSSSRMTRTSIRWTCLVRTLSALEPPAKKLILWLPSTAAFRSDASQPMDANYAIACQWHVSLTFLSGIVPDADLVLLPVSSGSRHHQGPTVGEEVFKRPLFQDPFVETSRLRHQHSQLVGTPFL